MKRIIGISIFVMFIFITAGCYKSYEEYKPKEIAKWDGNYIYYENKVSKTTGETRCLNNPIRNLYIRSLMNS